ncbi:hypothetical protein DL96DRAFT_1557514 [Flagelloscypha sp. PMI_526]|nr:hypothetical protein DL96DRAFT_1557514 [Flagelloscypha sp. PMI_526]
MALTNYLLFVSQIYFPFSHTLFPLTIQVLALPPFFLDNRSANALFFQEPVYVRFDPFLTSHLPPQHLITIILIIQLNTRFQLENLTHRDAKISTDIMDEAAITTRAIYESSGKRMDNGEMLGECGTVFNTKTVWYALNLDLEEGARGTGRCV